MRAFILCWLFLRVSELLNLQRFDVNIVDFFFIEKSKTDICRDSNWLIISPTGTTLCPVLNLERYIKYEYANFKCDVFYRFRNITKLFAIV